MAYDVVPHPNHQEGAETAYMGHTVHFRYFPERITLAWVEKVQASDDLNDMVMLTNSIEYVLAEWDVTYGEGPFPPTSENLRYIPLGLLMNILEAMQAHQQVIRKGGPKIPALQSLLNWFGERWEETAPGIDSKIRGS